MEIWQIITVGVGSVLVPLLTTWATILAAKRRSKMELRKFKEHDLKQLQTNDFQALVKANSEFREEVRSELLVSKARIRELEELVANYQDEIKDLKTKIMGYEAKISEYKRELGLSEQKIEAFKLRVQTLEKELNKNETRQR